MKEIALSITMMLVLLAAANVEAAVKQPISLHPLNPRYFMFRGQPTLLITSAEHYGAVLNLDFAQKPYLDELKRSGMNYTRIFTGAYCESTGDFQIPHNTLAPAEGRLICPWARSNQPGYAGGGNKFDLNKWDKAYFDRLKGFIKEAGRRGIVVEISLFCPFYGDSMWNLSPMKSANNINGIGNCPSSEVYTLKYTDLTDVQIKMTKKIVTELRDFDNVIYEIANEPYFGGITLEWQKHIAAAIREAESKFKYRHLIAQNIANFSQKVTDPDPNVSILNFHYTHPPVVISENSGFKGVIGCDETGFQGQGDSPYREQGWDFILAGGGLYNNLDYSFTVTTPDGTARVEPPTPGGGSKKLRQGLYSLRRFIESFDFMKMHPDNSLKLVENTENITVYALTEPGRQYAAYIRGGSRASVRTDLPAGTYRIKWISPSDGALVKSDRLKHTQGEISFVSPDYNTDIALSIRKTTQK